MILKFKTKKIKGSPSGYFVTEDSISDKKLSGFRNIGLTIDVANNSTILDSILDKSWHFELKEYWQKCYLTDYYLIDFSKELSFFTLMASVGCSDMNRLDFEEKYNQEYCKKMAQKINFDEINYQSFYVFVR